MKNRDRDRRDKVRSRGEDRGSRREKKRFVYKKRDPAHTKRQASQSGGMYDNPFRSEFPIFSPKSGKSYRIRFMPPTWDEAVHFGFPVYVHSAVGADNNKYLCLQKHKKEECPICVEVAELQEAKEGEDAYKLKAKMRYGYWVIDRDNENEGPKIWCPSWVVDRDILSLAVDEYTNEVLNLDDDENGNDVSFKVIQEKQFPKIVAIKVASKSTPLSDDEDQMTEWLDYIQENPISECLQFHDAEHIENVLAGGVAKFKDDKDEKPKTRTDRKHRDDDDDEEEDEKPRRRSFRDDDEEEDDEEEEDESPRRKRVKLKKRRDRDVEDPDDDDDDIDEEAEEEGGDDDEQIDEESDEDEAERSPRDKKRHRPDHKSSARRKEKGVSRRRDDDD